MIQRFSFSLVLFALCATTAGAASIVDGDVDAGKQRAAACAACHGPKGNMESKQFPKLAGQGAPYIYEQLKLFKSGKRQNAIMAGQAAGLSDQDMKNLAVYFAAQQTKPGVSDATAAPAGATLYHGGDASAGIPACSGCHGPSGLGNAAAKFPRLSGQSTQYIITQLTAYREGKRSGYKKAAIMNGVAENLSDTEIKALASYVSGLAPTLGKDSVNHDGALMQVAAKKAAEQKQNSQKKEKKEQKAGGSDKAGADAGQQNAEGNSSAQSQQAAGQSSGTNPSAKDGADKSAKTDKADQGEQADKADQAGQGDKAKQAEKADKGNQAEPTDKADQAKQVDKTDQPEQSGEAEPASGDTQSASDQQRVEPPSEGEAQPESGGQNNDSPGQSGGGADRADAAPSGGLSQNQSEGKSSKPAQNSAGDDAGGSDQGSDAQ